MRNTNDSNTIKTNSMDIDGADRKSKLMNNNEER